MVVAKKTKKPSLIDLKALAWKEFSRYVRLRDCLKTTGTKTHGKCYTCGAEKPFKQLQAGHLVGGRGNAVLFDEDGVRAQCFGCNTFLGGRQSIFAQKLIEEVGLIKFEEIMNRRFMVVKFTPESLIIRRSYYKNKADELFKR